MNYEIYDEEKEEEKPVKQRLIFWMRNGCPTVSAVDERGCIISDLLRFNGEGRILRFVNVKKSLGFPLDGHGQVKGAWE